MLNRSQQQVFNEAIKWWKSGNEQTFEISGPPGSGKTFLLNYIIDSLNIDRDKIFLIDINEAPNTTITIRYEKPKNNQTQGIKFEEDYLFENVLCVETLHETSKDNI